MTAIDTGTTRSRGAKERSRRPRLGSIEGLVALVVLAILIRGWLAGLFTSPRAAAVATVFVSVLLAALPFLVAGILVTAGVRALLAPRPLHRWLRSRDLLDRPYRAVPVAALAAVVPPASDEAPELVDRGVPAGAVFAYQLAAPALSPVVLVATAVALPGHPLFVLARVVAGLLVALAMGWLWTRFGRATWLEATAPPRTEPQPDFWAYARVEVVRAGGVLVVGAFLTTLLTVAAPADWSRLVAGRPVFSVVALALLAVLVCVPAAAGPAVAACLSPFSLTARLVFLVAGPTVNLLRFSRQSIVYGPSFALRFAPATLVAAVVAVAAVSWLL